MNKNICILGRIAKNKDLYDGQTVLTRMLNDELKNQLKDYNFYYVDTYKYKTHIFKCLFKTIYCLFKCDNIVMLLSRNGLSFYLPFLYYSNKFFKKNIYHRVIGGSLDKLVEKHSKWVKYLNSLNYNYVELKSLSENLSKLGIKNTKVSPNFKHIDILKDNEIKKYTKNDEIRFCTFSRVVKEKGISDAIDTIEKYNLNNEKKVYLDIYGPIEDVYKEEFNNKIKESNYSFYKGIISSTDSVNVLKKYYMLLFPTYWKGEGFPGTLIDAFSSGLPTIATDWNYNSEIIENNKTGIIYDYKNKDLLYEKILYSINNLNVINEMRFNCIKEAKKYDPEIVVGEIVKDIKK